MKLSDEYLQCIGTTYSVEELVKMYNLKSIDATEEIAKDVIANIRKTVPVRKNWQYISHTLVLANGVILALVPTKNWSDGDGGPKYIFHFHTLYKKDRGSDDWKVEDVFCAKEFESTWFKYERELREEMS